MSKLMDKLLKAGSVSGASIMEDSVFFNNKTMVTTPLPILNVAFSGDIDGGFAAGITIVAGESKTFKSALSLYCLRSYLDKYPESIGILYDTEFGITPDYIKSFGIDPKRIIHIPVEHVEQLKFDFNKKLEELNVGDRVFFLVDSLGQLSSKKEFEDAQEEKSVTDMTRAKAIRSLFRLITIQLTKKELPCIIVNHIYKTQELYSKVVIPGGDAVTYSANTIFVITKAQEKNSAGELDGWQFTINIHKSRYVKEKSKLPFQVLYDGGIQKYSGILDMALDSGHVIKPKNGWYSLVNKVSGEIDDKCIRAKDFDCEEYAGKILIDPTFKSYVISKYKLAMLEMDDLDDEILTKSLTIKKKKELKTVDEIDIV